MNHLFGNCSPVILWKETPLLVGLYIIRINCNLISIRSFANIRVFLIIRCLSQIYGVMLLCSSIWKYMLNNDTYEVWLTIPYIQAHQPDIKLMKPIIHLVLLYISDTDVSIIRLGRTSFVQSTFNEYQIFNFLTYMLFCVFLLSCECTEFLKGHIKKINCNWKYLIGGYQMIWWTPNNKLMRIKSFCAHQLIHQIIWCPPRNTFSYNLFSYIRTNEWHTSDRLLLNKNTWKHYYNYFRRSGIVSTSHTLCQRRLILGQLRRHWVNNIEPTLGPI